MSEWIKCSDEKHEFPKDGQCVIASGHLYGNKALGRWVEPAIYGVDGEFHPCAIDDEGELVADYDADMASTTHWMPLPAPPSEEQP